MATSSVEDVPRSLEFLFSRNRFNVAVSRAMCLAFIVASPRLLESRARTIDQMRLVNALCRFVEIAVLQKSSNFAEPPAPRLCARGITSLADQGSPGVGGRNSSRL